MKIPTADIRTSIREGIHRDLSARAHEAGIPFIVFVDDDFWREAITYDDQTDLYTLRVNEILSDYKYLTRPNREFPQDFDFQVLVENAGKPAAITVSTIGVLTKELDTAVFMTTRRPVP